MKPLLENEFYVYIYLDPRKRGQYCYDNNISFLYEPVYIGKGKDQRYLQHLNIPKKKSYFKSKLQAISNEGFSKEEIQKYILIFRSNLEEQEAFDLEKELIKKIGRADLKIGPLCNLTGGGDGVNDSSGKIRAKISKSLSGENYPNYGKKLSVETRAKIKEAWARRKQKALENGKPLVSEETRKKISDAQQNVSEETRKKMSESHIGKKPSEETRQKMSEAQLQREDLRGRKLSEETRKKISESKSGSNHPNFGKHHSEETRQKLSEAWNHRERNVSEETRQKISDAQKGRKLSEEELQKRIGRKTSEATKMKIAQVSKDAWALRKQKGFVPAKLSNETRNKISESMRGKKCSEETCQKISEAKKGKAPFSGKNHPCYGKSQSEETRSKISMSLRGKMSGENNPNYGKKISEETRIKLKEAWARRKQRALESGMSIKAKQRKKKSELQT